MATTINDSIALGYAPLVKPFSFCGAEKQNTPRALRSLTKRGRTGLSIIFALFFVLLFCAHVSDQMVASAEDQLPVLLAQPLLKHFFDDLPADDALYTAEITNLGKQFPPALYNSANKLSSSASCTPLTLGGRRVNGLSHTFTGLHREPYPVTFISCPQGEEARFTWRSHRLNPGLIGKNEVGEGFALSDILYQEAPDGRWQASFYGGNRWKLAEKTLQINKGERLTSWCSCYVIAGSNARRNDASFVVVNFNVGQAETTSVGEACGNVDQRKHCQPLEMLKRGAVRKRMESEELDPWMEYYPATNELPRGTMLDAKNGGGIVSIDETNRSSLDY